MIDVLIEQEVEKLASEESQREDKLNALIGRIERREEILSHSSFNEFCKSPLHFIRYKLREKVTTPAMLFGSMVHCLVLEPDEFANRYFIAPVCDRRTKQGKLTWANALEQAGNKEMVKGEDYEKALKIKNRIYQNGASRWVMDNITHTEVSTDWDFGGYRWRGHIDGMGESIMVDLKKVVDASPRKVEHLIKYERYGRQPVHYLRSKGNRHEFYFIAFDDKANISVHRMTKGALSVEREAIDFYMNKFQYCAFKGYWGQSYDFYAPNGGIYDVR